MKSLTSEACTSLRLPDESRRLDTCDMRRQLLQQRKTVTGDALVVCDLGCGLASVQCSRVLQAGQEG